MKLLGMVILCIMLIFAPLQLDSELQGRREELKSYISIIEKEIISKEDELASLDGELIELEDQYNRMLQENEKITERINILTQAVQK